MWIDYKYFHVSVISIQLENLISTNCLLYLLQTSSSDLSSQSSWSSQTHAFGMHWPDFDLQAHSSGPHVRSTEKLENGMKMQCQSVAKKFEKIKVIHSFVCLPHKFELSSLLSSQSGSPSHCHLEGIHLPSVQRNSAALQDVFSTGSWLIQKRKYAKS